MPQLLFTPSQSIKSTQRPTESIPPTPSLPPTNRNTNKLHNTTATPLQTAEARPTVDGGSTTEPPFEPLPPYGNLDIVKSPRNRGLGGCPAWLAYAMSRPCIPKPVVHSHPTTLSKPSAPSAIQPFTLTRVPPPTSPHKRAAYGGLGKRKMNEIDQNIVGGTKGKSPVQQSPPIIEQKLDIKMSDPSFHCDFCNKTYRCPIGNRHTTSDACTRNKAVYESKYGPVPPGLRPGQGHHVIQHGNVNTANSISTCSVSDPGLSKNVA